MKKLSFILFLFPFLSFAHEMGNITSTRVRTGIEVPYTPVYINFTSGPEGATLGNSIPDWRVSVGQSYLIESGSGDVIYAFCPTASSSNPVTVVFSFSEAPGGGDSGGGDSGGGDSGGGDSFGPYARETTLQSTNSSLSSLHTTLQTVSDNLFLLKNNNYNQLGLISDAFYDNSDRNYLSYLENVKDYSNDLDSLSSTLDDIYTKFGILDTKLASLVTKADTSNFYLEKISRSLENDLDRTADAVESIDDSIRNASGTIQDENRPEDFDFSSPSLTAIKNKLVPNYSFFGTISGRDNFDYDFVFSFAGLTDATDGIRVHFVEGGSSSRSRSSQILDLDFLWDLLRLIRNLLKVLIAYYFLKMVILTIKVL